MEFPYRKAKKFSQRSLGNISDNLKFKIQNADNLKFDNFKPIQLPTKPIPRRQPPVTNPSQTHGSHTISPLQPQPHTQTSVNPVLDTQSATIYDSNTPKPPSPIMSFNLPSTAQSDIPIPSVWQNDGPTYLPKAQSQIPATNQTSIGSSIGINLNPSEDIGDRPSPQSTPLSHNIPTIPDFLDEDTQSSIDLPIGAPQFPSWAEQDSSMSLDLPPFQGDLDSSIDHDPFANREASFEYLPPNQEENAINEDQSEDLIPPYSDPHIYQSDRPEMDDSLKHPSMESIGENSNQMEEPETNLLSPKATPVENEHIVSEFNSNKLETEDTTLDYRKNIESNNDQVTHQSNLSLDISPQPDILDSQSVNSIALQQQEEVITHSQSPKESLPSQINNSLINSNNNENTIQHINTENTARDSLFPFSSLNTLNKSNDNIPPPVVNANATLWHGIALPAVINRPTPVVTQIQNTSLAPALTGTPLDTNSTESNFINKTEEGFIPESQSSNHPNQHPPSSPLSKKRPLPNDEDEEDDDKPAEHPQDSSSEDEEKDDQPQDTSPKQSFEENEAVANFSPLQSEMANQPSVPSMQNLPSSFFNYTHNQNINISRNMIAPDPTLERTPSPTWGPSINMPTQEPVPELELSQPAQEQPTQQTRQAKKKKKKNKKKNKNKNNNNANNANNSNNSDQPNTNNPNPKPIKQGGGGSHGGKKYKMENFHDYDQLDTLDRSRQNAPSNQDDDFSRLLQAYQSQPAQDTNPSQRQNRGRNMKGHSNAGKGAKSAQSQDQFDSGSIDRSSSSDHPRRSSRLTGTEKNYSDTKSRKKS